jgi:hypothetical protein
MVLILLGGLRNASFAVHGLRRSAGGSLHRLCLQPSRHDRTGLGVLVVPEVGGGFPVSQISVAAGAQLRRLRT